MKELFQQMHKAIQNSLKTYSEVRARDATSYEQVAAHGLQRISVEIEGALRVEPFKLKMEDYNAYMQKIGLIRATNNQSEGFIFKTDSLFCSLTMAELLTNLTENRTNYLEKEKAQQTQSQVALGVKEENNNIVSKEEFETLKKTIESNQKQIKEVKEENQKRIEDLSKKVEEKDQIIFDKENEIKTIKEQMEERDRQLVTIDKQNRELRDQLKPLIFSIKADDKVLEQFKKILGIQEAYLAIPAIYQLPEISKEKYTSLKTENKKLYDQYKLFLTVSPAGYVALCILNEMHKETSLNNSVAFFKTSDVKKLMQEVCKRELQDIAWEAFIQILEKEYKDQSVIDKLRFLGAHGIQSKQNKQNVVLALQNLFFQGDFLPKDQTIAESISTFMGTSNNQVVQVEMKS